MDKVYQRFVAMLAVDGKDAPTYEAFALTLFTKFLDFERYMAIIGMPISAKAFRIYLAASFRGKEATLFSRFQKALKKKPKINVPKTPKLKPLLPPQPRAQQQPRIDPGLLAPNPSAPLGYRIVIVDGHQYIQRIEPPPPKTLEDYL